MVTMPNQSIQTEEQVTPSPQLEGWLKIVVFCRR